jgi:RimJ/RimL family protein N-acetyltransferase
MSTLLAVAIDDVEALSRGDAGGRPTAPGWPHDDTSAGFSFVRTGGTQFLIIDDDGRIAGECGTKAPPDDSGTVEIGYGLAGPSRGHGLGSRAVAELVGWLVGQPEVRTIEAEIHVSNEPSRRIVEKLGFVPDTGDSGGYLRYRLSVSD